MPDPGAEAIARSISRWSAAGGSERGNCGRARDRGLSGRACGGVSEPLPLHLLRRRRRLRHQQSAIHWQQADATGARRRVRRSTAKCVERRAGVRGLRTLLVASRLGAHSPRTVAPIRPDHHEQFAAGVQSASSPASLWVLDRVKPERDQNPVEERRRDWWLFTRPIRDLSIALGLWPPEGHLKTGPDISI